MNSRPDPQKAIYLKPQQRTWERRGKRPFNGSLKWVRFIYLLVITHILRAYRKGLDPMISWR